MPLPSERWWETLLVGHRRARIVSLHPRLQLGRIDFPALSPFDQVGGLALRFISKLDHRTRFQILRDFS
jgi:hypothetical protein